MNCFKTYFLFTIQMIITLFLSLALTCEEEELHLEGSIEGVVYAEGMGEDGDFGPIEQVEVRITSLDANNPLYPDESGSDIGIMDLTDEDGQYSFFNIPLGQYRLTYTDNTGNNLLTKTYDMELGIISIYNIPQQNMIKRFEAADPGDVKVVLTWNKVIDDLDLHLSYGTDASGTVPLVNDVNRTILPTCIPDEEESSTCYGDSSDTAWIATNNNAGGPEILYIKSFPYNGTPGNLNIGLVSVYAIDNSINPSGRELGWSEANVEIYQKGSDAPDYTFKVFENVGGNTWRVFALDSSLNIYPCGSGSLNSLNASIDYIPCITFVPSVNGVGDASSF